jgi:putative hemolysin
MYLALGARLCGPPVIGREVRTIDSLTWLGVSAPGQQALRERGRFVPQRSRHGP